jgi:hypothetical protein
MMLLMLAPLMLPAQSAPELIELDTENLAYDAWQDISKELLAPQTRLGLDNRLWLEDDSFSLHRAWFRYKGQELSINYRNNWTHGSAPANFNVRVRQDKLLQDLALGHYRIRFGSGIALGSGSRQLSGPVTQIEGPPQPERYSPFGAAMKLQWQGLATTLYASVLNREARLNAEDDMLSLPKNRLDIDTTARESIWGSALSYEARLFRLGLLAYEQTYSRDFADPDLKRASTVFSAYGGLRLNAHSIDLESGQVNGDQHHYLAWNYRHQGFEQTLSLAIDPDQSQVAHSTPREVLSRDPDTMELAWDTVFPLFKDADLALRFSADHLRGTGLSTGNLRTRLLAAFIYKQKDNSFSFRVAHFDREVLLHIDETYSMTRPKHWRFELGFEDRVLPYLAIILQTRYHIEDKSTWENNGLYFHTALRFKPVNLALSLGYQGWQSSRSGFYYEDDTPLAYAISTRDDQFIYLAADLSLKRIRLGLNIRQSLKQGEDRRLILRLGTWL